MDGAYRGREEGGGGLMVNEADGWTANRDKVRNTRWTK